MLFCIFCSSPLRFPRVKAEAQNFTAAFPGVVDRRFIFQTTRVQVPLWARAEGISPATTPGKEAIDDPDRTLRAGMISALKPRHG
jgi:hypothetical protein